MKTCNLRSYARIAVLASLCTGIQLQYARAQVGFSELNGVVSDTSAAVVPNATVTITSIDTKVSRTAITNTNGAFSVPDLNAGIYDISVEATGFKKTLLQHVNLYVGQATTQDIRLEVGATDQTVTVTSQAPLLNTTTGQVGTVIVQELVTQLPLNGRDFLQLNLLLPGATHDKNLVTADIVDINPANTTYSVNGQRGDDNTYLLDGTIVKDYQHGTAPIAPSVDSIEEFQTATSNYSAAFGVEAAGQVNLVTRSGKNRIFGTLWEYLRNDHFDARNFFQQGATPPFKRNQFGANIGGPIILPHIYDGKDRSFFFFNYEGFRQDKSIPTLGNYPTPEQINGDLSSLVQPGLPLIDPQTGQPFPGNIIPQTRMPSTQLPFLTNGIGKGPWIPVPNSTVPGADYFRNIPNIYNANQVVVRLDHHVGNKTSLYGHVVIDKEFARNAPSAYPGVSLNPNWSFDNNKYAHSDTIHLTRLINPRFLFDFNFGWSGFWQEVVQSTAYKTDITGSILKIQGLSHIPGSFGAPVWSVSGYDNLGESTIGPRRWPLSILQWTPSMTLTTGKHNLQWGAQILRHHYDFQESIYPNGIWIYTGAFTGYSMGDFLLGLPQELVAVPTPFAPAPRASEFGPYFEDDWKVTPNLTLNLGLRYEWLGFPYSSNRTMSNVYLGADRVCGFILIPGTCTDQFVTYDDARPLTFQGETFPLIPTPGLLHASNIPGLAKSLVFNDNRDFAPRFGFAFRPAGSTNLVIRGGYGVFYQRDVLNETFTLGLNPPFAGIDVLVNDSSNIQNFNWFNPVGNITPAQLQKAFVDMHFRPATVQEWNLTLERSVRSTLFSAAYVGNTGAHLPTIEAPNQAMPGPGPIESRRPWPGQGTVSGEGYNGSANYNGLQLRVQKDFSKGFALIVGYTWSKSIDDTGGGGIGDDPTGVPQNNYDRAAVTERRYDHGEHRENNCVDDVTLRTDLNDSKQRNRSDRLNQDDAIENQIPKCQHSPETRLSWRRGCSRFSLGSSHSCLLIERMQSQSLVPRVK